MTAATGVAEDYGLEASYDLCQELHRAHGRTYYWATRLLPAGSRRHVHALYGFCRYADEIVDETGGPTGRDERAERLAQLRARLVRDLAAGRSGHPVLAALVDTAVALRLDATVFDRFLASMEMDLTVTSYDSFADLMVYMDGSAAVIGEMMLPVLDPDHSPAAVGPARALGLAFQMTNFLRDVAEDLDRGRVYLPAEDLARFGADPKRRRADRPWVDLMRFEIERTRRLYAQADAGPALLPPRSAACIRAARLIYSGILDRIERQGYDVFTQRARVGTPRKVALTAAGLAGRPRPASREARYPGALWH